MAEAEIYDLIMAGAGLADSAPENEFMIEGPANVMPAQGGESQYGTWC